MTASETEQEITVTPIPDDGKLDWRRCYFAPGTRVEFYTRRWAGFTDQVLAAQVESVKRNARQRVSYTIKFLSPAKRFGRIVRTMQAELEDLVVCAEAWSIGTLKAPSVTVAPATIKALQARAVEGA